MAALYPYTQGGGPTHQKYQRSYTPYVFQPNFLKQQVRQRDGDRSGHRGYDDHLGHGGGHMGGGYQNANINADDNLKKKSGRKVIDWTSSCALYVERRKWQREFLDVPSLIPDTSYSLEMQSTMAYRHCPVSSVATKFVRSATNKMKCPVYKVVWTPDGRRLVTGSASGEFTLWNGTAFNFETILQAHDSPVRAMSWSRNDTWLITGDNQGYIKYWQLNMNNVKMYQAHKDQACRSVCFGPTDNKFATASDDGTVRVWDFHTCKEEHILRGHGADVKQVDWHPQKSLIASASKDLQTPVKLWDPKSGTSLCTIHAHKGTVMDVKWNRNGNWFLTASRDHLIKLYDIRNLKQERQVFRGHKKEAFTVAWHPIHEDLFASGGSEGSIMFWQIGEDKDVGSLEGAHESLIWSLAWHPLGHILVSGSNDHSTKFWTRNRPGDAARMRDVVHATGGGSNNLLSHDFDHPLLARTRLMTGRTNQQSATAAADGKEGEKKEEEKDEKKTADEPVIPGMGDTDEAAAYVARMEEEKMTVGIPGLDWSRDEKNEFEKKAHQETNKKKIPFARPVPRSFLTAWESKRDSGSRRHMRSPSPPPRASNQPRGLPRDRSPLRGANEPSPGSVEPIRGPPPSSGGGYHQIDQPHPRGGQPPPHHHQQDGFHPRFDQHHPPHPNHHHQPMMQEPPPQQQQQQDQNFQDPSQHFQDPSQHFQQQPPHDDFRHHQQFPPPPHHQHQQQFNNNNMPPPHQQDWHQPPPHNEPPFDNNMYPHQQQQGGDMMFPHQNNPNQNHPDFNNGGGNMQPDFNGGMYNNPDFNQQPPPEWQHFDQQQQFGQQQMDDRRGPQMIHHHRGGMGPRPNMRGGPPRFRGMGRGGGPMRGMRPHQRGNWR